MFIDANIFISSVLSKDRRGVKCRNFLDRVWSGEKNAVTSILVLSEVLNIIGDLRGNDFALRAARAFISNPHLEICEINFEDFSQSLEYYSLGLLSYDSLHAAVMKRHGIETIISYDKDFDGLSGIRRVEP